MVGSAIDRTELLRIRVTNLANNRWSVRGHDRHASPGECVTLNSGFENTDRRPMDFADST